MVAVLTQPDERTDEDLAQRIASGDAEALADLYERYVDVLNDFAVWAIGDRGLAQDVVQDTFMKAWNHLQRSGPPTNVRAWLYQVVRNRSIDEHRRRRREIVADAEAGRDEGQNPFATALSPVTAEPEAVLADRETVDLFWSAVGGLSTAERTLIDLQLRRGFSADDIASTLGLQKGAVYTRLSRLRNAIERSVTTTLLARRGRNDCRELDALLSAHPRGNQLSAADQRTVQRHAAKCAVCSESQKRFTSPHELFSLLPLCALSHTKRGAMWRLVCARLDIDAERPVARGASTSRSLLRGLAVHVVVCIGVAVLIATVLTWPARGDYNDKFATYNPARSGLNLPPAKTTNAKPAGHPRPQRVVPQRWIYEPAVEVPAVEYTDTAPAPGGPVMGEAGTAGGAGTPGSAGGQGRATSDGSSTKGDCGCQGSNY